MNILRTLKEFIPAGIRPQALAVRVFERNTESGTRVAAGPFRGMRYGAGALGSAWFPKLMGTYELELHQVINHFCDGYFRLIVDVGAAEGYYAIGLALRCPSAQVLAFETVPEGQELIQMLASLNNVQDRVAVHGYCDLGALREALLNYHLIGDALIVMDVEGAERDLLLPDEIPELKQAHILVELHDCWYPGLDSTIESRFASSHCIERIWATKRSAANLPFRSLFLNKWLLRLTFEFRPEGMSWLYMRPKKEFQ